VLKNNKEMFILYYPKVEKTDLNIF